MPCDPQRHDEGPPPPNLGRRPFVCAAERRLPTADSLHEEREVVAQRIGRGVRQLRMALPHSLLDFVADLDEGLVSHSI